MASLYQFLIILSFTLATVCLAIPMCEHFITIAHSMTKDHFISFVAFTTSDRIQLVKLYPEGNAQTRLQLRSIGYLFYYCNRHGLYKRRFPKR